MVGVLAETAKPLPPTWKSLLNVLREINLGHLANQIDAEVSEEPVSPTSAVGPESPMLRGRRQNKDVKNKGEQYSIAWCTIHTSAFLFSRQGNSWHLLLSTIS